MSFLPKMLLTIFVLILLSSISFAQVTGLTADEETFLRRHLCHTFSGHSGGGGGRVDPKLMKIVSFSRSPSGHIVKARGQYQFTDPARHDNWIDLYADDDGFMYASIASDNPFQILPGMEAGPDGTFNPYTGSNRVRAIKLQKALRPTL